MRKILLATNNTMEIKSTHMRNREPQPLEGTGVRASVVGMADCLAAGGTMEEKLFVLDEVAMLLGEFEAAEGRCRNPSGLATGCELCSAVEELC